MRGAREKRIEELICELNRLTGHPTDTHAIEGRSARPNVGTYLWGDNGEGYLIFQIRDAAGGLARPFGSKARSADQMIDYLEAIIGLARHGYKVEGAGA